MLHCGCVTFPFPLSELDIFSSLDDLEQDPCYQLTTEEYRREIGRARKADESARKAGEVAAAAKKKKRKVSQSAYLLVHLLTIVVWSRSMSSRQLLLQSEDQTLRQSSNQTGRPRNAR